MSQPSTAVPSSDEDEAPQRTPAKTPSKPGPLSKKTPPGPFLARSDLWRKQMLPLKLLELRGGV
jgi:hypothetical protein